MIQLLEVEKSLLRLLVLGNRIAVIVFDCFIVIRRLPQGQNYALPRIVILYPSYRGEIFMATPEALQKKKKENKINNKVAMSRD